MKKRVLAVFLSALIGMQGIVPVAAEQISHEDEILTEAPGEPIEESVVETVVELDSEEVEKAGAVVKSGECGDNLTWALTDDGVLTISGSGNMWDYYYDTPAPWSEILDSGEPITNVVILDGVTSIGDYAFAECHDVTSVEMPAGIRRIGERAFYCCWDLSFIEIPDSTEEIGRLAFGITGLTGITIPANVQILGEVAFSDCRALREIHFEGDAPSIGDSCFNNDQLVAFYDADKNGWTDDVKQNYDAIGLLWVKEGDEAPDIASMCGDEVTWSLEDGVLTIRGTGDMWDYSGDGGMTMLPTPWMDYSDDIDTAVVESGVTSIGDHAFGQIPGLISVSIPEGVTRIGKYAFWSSNNLQDIHLPESLTYIGDNAFSDALDTIYFTGDAPTFADEGFGYCFYDVTATAYYPVNNPTWTSDVMQDYGGTITWVPYDLNLPIYGEPDFTLPASTITIEESAFEGNKMTVVYIPDTCTSIGAYAFKDCDSLTQIRIPGDCTIADNAFDGCEGVYIFGTAGSDAESYCSSHEGFTFVEE